MQSGRQTPIHEAHKGIEKIRVEEAVQSRRQYPKQRGHRTGKRAGIGKHKDDDQQNQAYGDQPQILAKLLEFVVILHDSSPFQMI